MDKAAQEFIKFREIIARLRNPNGGCPWDIKQTHKSLKPFLLEECYEALEAIDSNPGALCGELGDVLLQIFLHAQIASETKNFDIGDVVEQISTKIVSRHPHVFGDVKAGSAEEVKQTWEQNKKKSLKADQSVLDSIPKSLPGCARAFRLGEKAAALGFDWPDSNAVKGKIEEELGEFLAASKGSDNHTEELGDLLFAIVQYARKEGINAEDALAQACSKFQERFRKVEIMAGEGIKSMSLEQLEELWKEAKK
jgi:tetrapyrrole methylase family protein/MazG family protein